MDPFRHMAHLWGAAFIIGSLRRIDEQDLVPLQRIETADTVKKAETYRDKVATAMQALRTDIDVLEMIVPRDTWPVPAYADLLFKL